MSVQSVKCVIPGERVKCVILVSVERVNCVILCKCVIIGMYKVLVDGKFALPDVCVY